MLKLIRFSLLSATIVFVSCVGCSYKKCEPKSAKRIATIREINGYDTSYMHEILIEGATKDCDNLTVMTIVNNYIDEQTQFLPISGVEVYRSKENYDPGESLSQPKSFYGDCVVGLWLDIDTKKPESFYFFDTWGDRTYEGSSWHHR